MYTATFETTARRLALPAVIVVAALYSYFAISRGLGWGDDPALYIEQARALVDGTVRELKAANTITSTRSTDLFGPVFYPWGLPLLLAPVYRLFGLNLFALKLVGWFSFVIMLCMLLPLLGTRARGAKLFLVVAAVGLNPEIISHIDSVGSDLPFMAVSFLALYAIDVQIVSNRTVFGTVVDRILLGLTLGAAILLRTVGVVLIPVLLVSWIIASRRRGAQPFALNAGTALELVPYAVCGAMLLGLSLAIDLEGILTSSHMDHFNMFRVRQPLTHLAFYAHIGSQLFSHPILYGVTIPFAIRGIYLRRRDDYLFHTYCLATLGALLLWPYTQGTRFALPLFPFYCYYLVQGSDLDATPTTWPSRLRLLAPIVFIVVVCFAADQRWRFAFHHMRHASLTDAGRRIHEGPFTQDNSRVFDFIAAHTAPDARIVFRKPRFMRLLTQQNSLMISRCGDISPSDIVVLDKRTGVSDQIDVASECMERLRAVRPVAYEDESFVVFSAEK